MCPRRAQAVVAATAAAASAMTSTIGGASAPTHGSRLVVIETKPARRPMRCSSTSRGDVLNSCRLKRTSARAAAVAVGLGLAACSGGAYASTRLAPHLATTAPLTSLPISDGIRRSEFLGWRGRRRQSSRERRTLFAGTAVGGLVAESAGKCGGSVGEETGVEGEWRTAVML